MFAHVAAGAAFQPPDVAPVLNNAHAAFEMFRTVARWRHPQAADDVGKGAAVETQRLELTARIEFAMISEIAAVRDRRR